MTDFDQYRAHLDTLTTIPEMEAEVLTRRQALTSLETTYCTAKEGDFAPSGQYLDTMADARTRLRLAERALNKLVAAQLRTLEQAHYELVCPWWAATEVKR